MKGAGCSVDLTESESWFFWSSQPDLRVVQVWHYWHGVHCVLKTTLTSADLRRNSILFVNREIQYKNQQLTVIRMEPILEEVSLPMACSLHCANHCLPDFTFLSCNRGNEVHPPCQEHLEAQVLEACPHKIIVPYSVLTLRHFNHSLPLEKV